MIACYAGPVLGLWGAPGEGGGAARLHLVGSCRGPFLVGALGEHPVYPAL